MNCVCSGPKPPSRIISERGLWGPTVRALLACHLQGAPQGPRSVPRTGPAARCQPRDLLPPRSARSLSHARFGGSGLSTGPRFSALQELECVPSCVDRDACSQGYFADLVFYFLLFRVLIRRPPFLFFFVSSTPPVSICFHEQRNLSTGGENLRVLPCCLQESPGR